MPSLWPLGMLILVGLFLAWFTADLNYSRRWSLRRAELGAKKEFRELNAHFESGLRRPWLLFFRRWYAPGLLEADYALHLSKQGENEKALSLLLKASSKAAKRPAVQLLVLPAQALVFHRLGRYDEA